MTRTRPTPLLVLLAGAAACGPLRIPEPDLEDVTADLARSTADLADTGPDTDPDTLQSSVEAVGHDLVALALAHHRWATDGPPPGLPPSPADLPEPPVAPVDPAWDDDTLRGVFDVPETSTTYDVRLRWVRGRTRPEATDGGWAGGVPGPVAHARWHALQGHAETLPPALTGPLHLWTEVELDGEPVHLDLHAAWVDLTLDGDGCTAGGGLELTYRLVTDTVSETSWVRAGYHGCGRGFAYGW